MLFPRLPVLVVQQRAHRVLTELRHLPCMEEDRAEQAAVVRWAALAVRAVMARAAAAVGAVEQPAVQRVVPVGMVRRGIAP